TLDAYLAWENTQETRNEFYRGEVFAMVGARRSHGTVVSNLVRHLGNALDGSPCRVFNEGMKVQVGQDAVFYPDVFVTCDKTDLSTDILFRAPSLVIEVLSPATEAYDRSQKFAIYRGLASLKEYMLIDPETRRVESFLRGVDGLFVLHDMSGNDEVRFFSLNIAVPTKAIFAGV
ncbi:MAG: Uma2 family endonuclease, partial [Burkholderiales bacterium]